MIIDLYILKLTFVLPPHPNATELLHAKDPSYRFTAFPPRHTRVHSPNFFMIPTVLNIKIQVSLHLLIFNIFFYMNSICAICNNM